MKIKFAWIVTRSFEFEAIYEHKTLDSVIRADFLKAWKAHCSAYPSAEPEYGKELIDDISIIEMTVGKWHRDKEQM